MATTTRCTGTFLGGRCPHPVPCPIHPAMSTDTYCDHCQSTAPCNHPGGAHTDRHQLGCAVVTLALLLSPRTINAPGYPYRLTITTQSYGELVSQPDIWEHDSAGTMVGGYWGPYRIFASVPLSAIDAYLVRKEN